MRPPVPRQAPRTPAGATVKLPGWLRGWLVRRRLQAWRELAEGYWYLQELRAAAQAERDRSPWTDGRLWGPNDSWADYP